MSRFEYIWKFDIYRLTLSLHDIKKRAWPGFLQLQQTEILCVSCTRYVDTGLCVVVLLCFSVHTEPIWNFCLNSFEWIIRALSKKSNFHFDHIPNRTHSKKTNTLQKGHIPFWSHCRWAHSKQGTSHFDHIPKKAHSKKNTSHFDHIPKKAHPILITFQKMQILLWSHSILFTFRKEHTPKPAHHVLITLQEGHIPKKSTLQKGAFWLCHIPNRAHPKIQRRAYSKKSIFQKRHISFWSHSQKGTFQKEYIPKRVNSE